MKKFTIVCLISFIWGGCMNTSENEKNKIIQEIQALEKRAFQPNSTFDLTLADSLIKKYSVFASNYTNDSLAAEYTFKQAEIFVAKRSYKSAIQTLEKLKKDFPDFKKNPESAFMIAFIYDEHLKLKDKASVAYQNMANDYPDHPLAENALIQKENLKYSNQELIEMFKNKAPLNQ